LVKLVGERSIKTLRKRPSLSKESLIAVYSAAKLERLFYQTHNGSFFAADVLGLEKFQDVLIH